MNKIAIRDYSDDKEILGYCSKLLFEGLEQTNNAFSSMIFWNMTIFMIMTTLCTYFVISFFIDLNEFNSLTLRIIWLLASFLSILYVIYINFLSDEVSNNLNQLKFYIHELKTDEKDRIIEKINSFQGFDACRFFTLGKPLLTSIVANFMTYIIVLIQFKTAKI